MADKQYPIIPVGPVRSIENTGVHAKPNWVFSNRNSNVKSASYGNSSGVFVKQKRASSPAVITPFGGRLFSTLFSVEFIAIMFVALVIGVPLMQYTPYVKEQFTELNTVELYGMEHYGCYDVNNERVACSVPVEYNFREVGTEILGGITDFLFTVEDTTQWISDLAVDIKNFFDDGINWDPSQLQTTNSQSDAIEYFMTQMSYEERIFYRDEWLPAQQFQLLYYTYNQLNVI